MCVDYIFSISISIDWIKWNKMTKIKWAKNKPLALLLCVGMLQSASTNFYTVLKCQ